VCVLGNILTSFRGVIVVVVGMVFAVVVVVAVVVAVKNAGLVVAASVVFLIASEVFDNDETNITI